MTNQRGFITIATGKELYYRIAHNLLCSYKLSGGKYPFAIICDRENEYSASFDKVIQIVNPTNSYLDKLRLIDYTPYDETIFIDADCLVYGNIDSWWNLFESASDFSVFGCEIKDLDTKRGWFYTNGMREFVDRITYVPSFNGGVYYLRKTEKCGEVFRIAKYCSDHYNDYSFAVFARPADEPVLALGMTVSGCKPLNKEEVLFAPKRNMVAVDIIEGIATEKGKTNHYKLIHWSNYLTRKSLYKYEVGRMKTKVGNCSRVSRFMYEKKLAKAYLWIFDIEAIIYRIIRKIRKLAYS